MSSQRNPLNESVDDLLRSEKPHWRYLFTREGLRDWLCASLLAGICFGASYLIVCG